VNPKVAGGGVVAQLHRGVTVQGNASPFLSKYLLFYYVSLLRVLEF
jgi:hypothetical protein